MQIIKPEQNVNFLGVPARAYAVVADTETGRIVNQTVKVSQGYVIEEQRYRITSVIQFDDNCRNGHETFSITGDVMRLVGRKWEYVSSGCLHEEIATHFPEFAHLIRWHLVSTDGPIHYIANTLYLAGDRDCYGLRAGETRQIISSKTGLPVWKFVIVNDSGDEIKPLPSLVDSKDKPTTDLKVEWRPLLRIGEGKERELDKARLAACWPEATDEELSAPPGELAKALTDRLPGLLAAFRADIEAAGLLWPGSPQTMKRKSDVR